MGKSVQDRLIDLKHQAEQDRTRASELKGQYDHLMEELEGVWQCKTFEEGQKLLQELEKSRDNLQETLDRRITVLEGKYQR